MALTKVTRNLLNTSIDDNGTGTAITIASDGSVTFSSTISASGYNNGNWDTAYGWGDHASAGYLTSFTESDPTVPSHVKSITSANISNWDTAYGWGDHASAGYLDTSSTSQTKSGDLTVDQLITTNNANGTNVRIGDDAWIGDCNSANQIRIQGINDATKGYISFGSTSNTALGRSGNGDLTWGGGKVWHEGNDGNGSGLDADKLQGHLPSYFTGYTDTAIANLVDSSPSTLNTLNELAAALGDDANFSTTVSNQIGTKWTQDNTKISNWDTAYGWGNHASAGYLTSHQDISGKLDTSGGTLTGNLIIDQGTSGDATLTLRADTDNNDEGDHPQIRFQQDGDLVSYRFGIGTSATDTATSNNDLCITAEGSASSQLYMVTSAGVQHKFWHTGNDGSGSGLDADTVDGIQASSFLRSDTSDTATKISFGTGNVQAPTTSDSSTGARLILYPQGNGRDYSIGIEANTMWFNSDDHYKWYVDGTKKFEWDNSVSEFKISGNKVWHAGNDGSGSGLDADTVDGIQASSFLRSDANDTFSHTITGNKLYLGGSEITSSSAALQVNGFQRTGTIYLHEGTTAVAGNNWALETTSDGELNWNGNGCRIKWDRAHANGMALFINTNDNTNLSIGGHSGVNKINSGSSLSGGAANLSFSAGSSGELVRFTTGKQVGINNSSPSYHLDTYFPTTASTQLQWRFTGYYGGSQARSYYGTTFIGQSNSNGHGIALSTSSVYPAEADNSIFYNDNVMDIGTAVSRWDDVYATNGTIQTSDEREKQDIEALSDAEQRVAVAAKGLLRKFRWKDAVQEKGDNARTHFGIIAQDLQAAFLAEGLDPSKYAMFIKTEWWIGDKTHPAIEDELDDEGNVVVEGSPEHVEPEHHYDNAEDAPADATYHYRLGIRYSELLAFIISAI